MYGLFLLYLMTNVALVATGIVWGGIRKVEKEFKKTNTIIQKHLEHLTEEDLIPVLKERNITHFSWKEERMKIEVVYNGKTIFATLKVTAFSEKQYEEIFAFEYDITEDCLLYTERESYVYQKNDAYDELNPYLKKMTDRLIEIDWEKKASEAVQTKQELATNQKRKGKEKNLENQTQEMETLQSKAKSLLEHVDLLEGAEKKELHTLISKDIEETISFYQQTKKEDKELYEPIVREKLKEIDEKLETITNRIEERKYKAFKEKLKMEYTEMD